MGFHPSKARLPGQLFAVTLSASGGALQIGGKKYPAIALAWRWDWNRVIPFFALPEAVRKIIDTTNSIEALNAKLGRAVSIQGHFPTDEAATKLIWLVLRDATAEWKMAPREWGEAKSQFAILFEDRFIIV